MNDPGKCDIPAQPIHWARRDFVASAAAAVAGLAIAPGLMLYEVARGDAAAKGVSGKVRWGMLIDTTRCAEGCTACVDACREENGLGTGTRRVDSQWIRKVEIRNPKYGYTHSLPVMCQHCARPPCVDVCPTGASFKRADGIVLVDRHTCIGCRYCMMACPYKARSFVHENVTGQKPEVPRGRGTVEACSLCVHRVDAGKRPACVEACASAGHVAFVFGDLNDPTSAISLRIRERGGSQIRADLRLDTGVRYQGI